MIDNPKFMKTKYNSTKCRLCKKSEDLKHIIICEKNDIKRTEEESKEVIKNLERQDTDKILKAANEIEAFIEQR